jgi:1-acyl-sn-glycerol-3-phosphate acyltransferase
LKDNKGLILFPEGTRSPDGKLQPPKSGVGFIVCKSQVPVVPARIFGSYKAFGKGSSLRPGTPISVVFGKPIPPSAYDDPSAGKERYQVASTRIMAEIARLELPPERVV